jgi:hypothetical protein
MVIILKEKVQEGMCMPLSENKIMRHFRHFDMFSCVFMSIMSIVSLFNKKKFKK